MVKIKSYEIFNREDPFLRVECSYDNGHFGRITLKIMQNCDYLALFMCSFIIMGDVGHKEKY